MVISCLKQLDIWTNLSLEYIQKLYASIPRRIMACIRPDTLWSIKGRILWCLLTTYIVLSEAWKLLLSGSNFSVNTLETRLYMYILNCSYYEFLLIGVCVCEMCVFIHTLPYVLNLGLYWQKHLCSTSTLGALTCPMNIWSFNINRSLNSLSK
jgi:hypothetical protein